MDPKPHTRMGGGYGVELAGILFAATVLVPAIWLCTDQGGDREDAHPTTYIGATSGWCSGTTNSDRSCRFRNLCYSSGYDAFLFFHDERSVSEGIPDQRFQPALADLSSVPDHNTQYFHYVDVGLENRDGLPDRRTVFRGGKYLLFNRFNPSNLMHVFHDDLLPVFFTLLRHDLIQEDPLLTLVAFEGWVGGEYFDLYRPFSKDEPILKADLGKDTLTCFDDVYVGLSKLSTWYQYGFGGPQGPLPNPNVTSFHIRYFRDFYRARLNASRTCPAGEPATHGVLLSREGNRLIVNEAELAVTVSRVFNIKMLTLSLESQSLVEIIREVSCAKVLVGVHGSLMILSMFLPPASILLEIFPFAVNPDHYTPYKTLVSLPGMDLRYVSWRNTEERNTVTHPDAAPEDGGIVHLDYEDQERILRSSEVLPHHCCQDAEWLFRIYQDTVVDVPVIIELLTRAMVQGSHRPSDGWMDDRSKHHVAPGFISELSCSENKLRPGTYRVSWLQPWNVASLQLPKVHFEVWVQGQGSSDIDTYIVDETFVEIKSSENIEVYFVWVRAVAVETKGPQSWVQC